MREVFNKLQVEAVPLHPVPRRLVPVQNIHTSLERNIILLLYSYTLTHLSMYCIAGRFRGKKTFGKISWLMGHLQVISMKLCGHGIGLSKKNPEILQN